MDIRKLQRAIVDGLEDVKAQNILVFNTEKLSPLFERVIIASGTSNRQTKALASSVRETVKKRGMPVMATEGEDNGEWIIVDCGAAVAHIMQPAIRDYYHLEEIWGGKSVKLKAAEARPLPKAEEPPAARTSRPAPSTSARKTAAKAGAKPGGRTAAKAPKAVARTKTAHKATARKSTTPKTAAHKFTTRKTAAHKPTTPKSSAPKAAVPRKAAAPRGTSAKVPARKASKR
jgi:ribosome-associated protein